MWDFSIINSYVSGILYIDRRPYEEEVDASSTPILCGGYFPQFPQYDGKMSPIGLHRSIPKNHFGCFRGIPSN